MEKLFVFMVATCILLIVVMVATAYICDKLGIGKNTAPSAVSPVSNPPAYLNSVNMSVDFARKVMLPCLAENYQSCDLVLFRTVAQILPTDNISSVLYREDRGLCFQYELERRAQIGGSLKEGLSSEYSVYPLEKVVQKLNRVLSNYAISAGFPPCEIIDAENLAEGRIRLVIAANRGNR